MSKAVITTTDIVISQQYVLKCAHLLLSGVGKSSLVHLLCQNQVLGNPSWTVGCSVDVRVSTLFFSFPFSKNTIPCYIHNDGIITSRYKVVCLFGSRTSSYSFTYFVKPQLIGIFSLNLFVLKLFNYVPLLHRSKTTRRELQRRKPTTLSSGMLEDLSAVPAVSKAPEQFSTIQSMVKMISKDLKLLFFFFFLKNSDKWYVTICLCFSRQELSWYMT